MVALVSFQGSGNTWVRHFLEQATGVYTGSIYCDPGLKITYPGEYVVSGNVLVVKTHHADTTKLPPDIQQALSKQEYDKAIILVRNPYNALLSEGNRRWAGMMQPSLDQHVGVASEQAFIGEQASSGAEYMILLSLSLLQGIPSGTGMLSTREWRGSSCCTHGCRRQAASRHWSCSTRTFRQTSRMS